MKKKVEGRISSLKISVSQNGGFTFWVCAFLIATFALFFRFYNIPDRYGFDPDPVRDSIIASVGAENLQFPLSGPASGIAPFTFGPWYYYFLIAVKIVFPFEYSSWMLIGLFSLGFVFVMYKIGERLEGKYFGLLLALLAAISPAQTGPSAGLSNPNMVPLHAALTILLGLYHVRKNLSWRWLVLWGILYGVGVNHHYQMLGLIFIPLLLMLVGGKQVFKSIAFFMIGLLVSFIPLFVFNVAHDWHTVRGIIFYALDGRNTTYIPNSWTLYIRNFLVPFWGYLYGVSNGIGIVLAGVISIPIIVLSWKRKLRKEYVVLFVVLFVHLFALRYLISQRDYYYYIFLHPLLFVFGALGIWQISRNRFGKFCAIVLLGFIIVSVMPENWERLKSQPRNLEYREAANRLSSSYTGQKFTILTCERKLRQTYRERGIIFFLSNFDLLDSRGKRIGILSDECEAVSALSSQGNIALEYSDLGTLNDLVIIDLFSKSLNELELEGWSVVSPQSIYEESFMIR